jgi:hypothetical protein
LKLLGLSVPNCWPHGTPAGAAPDTVGAGLMPFVAAAKTRAGKQANWRY